MQNLRLQIWDEWLGDRVDDPSKLNCEIAGIIECMKRSISTRNVILKSNHLWVFRRLIKLWKLSIWSETFDITHVLDVPRNMHGMVSVTLPSYLHNELISFGKKCSLSGNYWNWIRGIWGNAGHIYLPKNGYNLVFRLLSRNIADRIVNRMKISGISVSTRQKNNYTEVMIRNQEDIVTLLSKMRLYNASLIIEQRSMVRAMRNRANKLVNCDSSNIRKSLEVAEKQINIAKTLKDSGYYDNLPPKLKEIIDVRIKNPSATLTELGTYLDKPVSKSTVKYRWSKIKQILDNRQ